MKPNFFQNIVGLASAVGFAATPLAVQAQASQAVADQLGLPDQVTLLADTDPNTRRATAVVNGQVVTGTDLNQRVALLTAANEQQLGGAELQQVREQVLRNLIDETLQIQAAQAADIAISQAEIDQTYARVAAQNFGQRTEQMDAYLTGIGSSSASLKRQIHGELAWQRLLRQKVAFFVNVSAEEVNELMQRLNASKGADEYRLGEIYLSANSSNQAAVEANAAKIMEQLRQGGSFVAYARQFSEASTAAVGGDLGWIRLPQLKNAQLEAAAQQMQSGQLVGPIAIPGGYSILYLIDKRQVLTADPRDALLSLKQIQVTFSPTESEAQNQARLQRFTEGVKTMRGCGDADQAAAALNATVVTNDQVRARSLPEQLQNIVLGLQIGQTTPPFGSLDEGVRVLMLCGRDDPQASDGPDFDELMAQLEDERIGKAAQRYLRDLRNDAYIEYN